MAVKTFLREAEFGARINHDTSSGPTTTASPNGVYYTGPRMGPRASRSSAFLTAAGRLAPPVAARIIQHWNRAGMAHKAGIILALSQARRPSCTTTRRRSRVSSISHRPGCRRQPRRPADPAASSSGTLQYGGARGASPASWSASRPCLQPRDHRLPLLTGGFPYPAKAPELFQQLLTQSPVFAQRAVRVSSFPPAIETAGDDGLEGISPLRWKDGERVRQRVLRRRQRRCSRQEGGLLLVAVPAERRVTPRESLAALLRERSVKFGDFVLSSGRRSPYYIDARKTTMSAQGQRLIGELGLAVLREAGWAPVGVGGLTMGADPVAYAIARASVDAPASVQAFTSESGQGARHSPDHRRQLRPGDPGWWSRMCSPPELGTPGDRRYPECRRQHPRRLVVWTGSKAAVPRRKSGLIVWVLTTTHDILGDSAWLMLRAEG